MRIIKTVFLASCLSFVFSGAGWAGDTYFIDQRNKQFSIYKLDVKVGDTLVFTNSDALFHNIHSLSKRQEFDLGSFSLGEKRAHLLKRKGVIEVRCAVHPFMKLLVSVD